MSSLGTGKVFFMKMITFVGTTIDIIGKWSVICKYLMYASVIQIVLENKIPKNRLSKLFAKRRFTKISR
jgi:hypothetical protein